MGITQQEEFEIMATQQPIDDGGTAFPQAMLYGSTGMSLRDWFAGQALEEDIQWHIRFKSNRITREQARYAYADAMIEARNKFSETANAIVDAMIEARKRGSHE